MYRGMLFYYKADALYNQSYICHYQELARQMGMEIQLFYYEDLLWQMDKTGFFLLDTRQKKRLEGDFAMNRTRKASLGNHLEKMGLLVTNSSKVTELGNDKWKMYQFVKEHTNLPCVLTHYMEELPKEPPLFFPEKEIIVKTVSGHGGSQVFCYPRQDWQEIRKKAGKAPVVIQPRISGIPRDVRVYVTGGKITAAILRTGEASGWKSNYSLGGRAAPYQLLPQEEKMVKELTKKLEIAMAGVDFLIDDTGKWYFNELEDMAGARMLYQCTPIDIAEEYLSYIHHKLKEGNF